MLAVVQLRSVWHVVERLHQLVDDVPFLRYLQAGDAIRYPLVAGAQL